MKFLIILTGLVCLSFMLLPACAPQAEEQAEPEPEAAPEPVFDQAAEEAAIRAAMERMYAAWNRHEAKGIVAEMDEDYETWGGEMKGLAAREKYWTEFFKTQKDAKVKVADVIGVVFVTPEVAIWKAHFESSGQLGEDGKPLPPSKLLAASVLAKKNGKWVEVAFFGRPIEE